jgi:hypothetical protein
MRNEQRLKRLETALDTKSEADSLLYLAPKGNEEIQHGYVKIGSGKFQGQYDFEIKNQQVKFQDLHGETLEFVEKIYKKPNEIRDFSAWTLEEIGRRVRAVLAAEEFANEPWVIKMKKDFGIYKDK